MKLSEADIKKIHDYFASQKDVVAVYLYGSFANENPHKGSDLDVAVLFDGEVDLYRRLGELYGDFPKLIVAAEPEVRNLSLEQSPVFLINVIRGEVLYSKDEQKRIRFEVEVMNIFRDTEYLRVLKYYYMDKSFKEGTYGHRLLNH